MTYALTVLLGAAGSLLAAYLLRVREGFLEFVSANLGNLTIISSFQRFTATGIGDSYSSVLFIRVRNSGAHALYVVRAVYFPDRKRRIPLYENASVSQKYRSGYEAKFGVNWFSHHTLIGPNDEESTYIPLSRLVADCDIPVRKRGRLLIEYVYDGKAGKHRTLL